MPEKNRKNSKPIKVLHVVHVMDYGGIETFLMNVLRNYDRDRFQMDIVYSGPREGEYADEVRELGSELISCRMSKAQYPFIRRLQKIIKQGNYDAVNSHIGDMGAGAMVAAKLSDVPARVASFHSEFYDMGFIKNFYLRTMRKIIARTATNITTSSPAVSNSHFEGVPVRLGGIYPIAYGVDVDFFSKLPKKIIDLQNFGFDKSNLIVGHVGSFRPAKNHEALIHIAAEVIKQVPQARFVLCGKGPEDYVSKIKQHISSLGLNTHFGFVSGVADMRSFYHAIDVFILPSRHEGMPVSIIEAQAACRPLVASKIDGIVLATAPEMQDNLFAIDEIGPFSSCLIELLKDEDLRKELGQNGYHFAKNKLDIRISVSEYERLYLPDQ